MPEWAKEYLIISWLQNTAVRTFFLAIKDNNNSLF